MLNLQRSNLFSKTDSKELSSPINLLFIGKDIVKYKSDLIWYEGMPGPISMFFNINERTSVSNDGFTLLHNQEELYSISKDEASEFSKVSPFTLINFIDESKKSKYFKSLSTWLYEFDNIEEVINDYLKVSGVINVIIVKGDRVDKEDLACAASSLKPYSRYVTDGSYNIASLIVTEDELQQGLTSVINLISNGLEEENVMVFKNNQLVRVNLLVEDNKVNINSMKM